MPFLALFSDEKDFKIQMFVLAWLLWLNCLNKQEAHAAKEGREMSREINEAHSTEVTLQKQNGRRERERRTEWGRESAQERERLSRISAELIYLLFSDLWRETNIF